MTTPFPVLMQQAAALRQSQGAVWRKNYDNSPIWFQHSLFTEEELGTLRGSGRPTGHCCSHRGPESESPRGLVGRSGARVLGSCSSAITAGVCFLLFTVFGTGTGKGSAHFSVSATVV